eukprot:TRINITY_DN10543_c0_g1_i1.p1 TRINITY_DN10543_c0_g1~~TRINITY_DN10543_c0_g1_i1.p1  ORF type:complete len:325 (+),score=79.60 TRINITY_DN10543_c0_g1_i1:228-1202(+)
MRRRGDYGDYVRHRMRRSPQQVSPALRPAAADSAAAAAARSSEQGEAADPAQATGCQVPVERSPASPRRRAPAYSSPYASPRRKPAPVIDWSFCGLSSASEVKRAAVPAAWRVRQREGAAAPSAGDDDGSRGRADSEDQQAARPNPEPALLQGTPHRPSLGPAGLKYAVETPAAGMLGVAVRLSHNHFITCDGLCAALRNSVRGLTSLDLSCNSLRSLPSDFCRPKREAGPDCLLPHLRALYLHSNELRSEQEVLKLGALVGLRLLTLHGNSGLDAARYRPVCLSLLPELRSLDFSAVTPTDRELATWRGVNSARAPSPLPRGM